MAAKVFMFILLMLLCGAGRAAGFEQDRFAIGFWVDPPMDDQAEMRYQRVADAHFNMVIGGFGANTREKVLRQIALCEEHGLKALVSRCDWPIGELPESPAVWGYMLFDEPHSDGFPELAELNAAIEKERPGKLGYVNLFPSTVSLERLGTESYEAYVRQFMEQVKPGVLSFDHYPIMKPGEDDRETYLQTLAIVRAEALERGVPFWNFFNTMPYGPHSDPTEGQLRWQMFASIAHGARGLMYFCYYTPAGDEFPKGGAIIGRDDKPTRHYDQARRINREIAHLGPVLMELKSERVVFVRPGHDPAEALAGTPVRNMTRAEHDPEHDFTVGVFTHRDGRRAVVMVNNRHGYTAWPTVRFDAESGGVREVCKATGEEIPVPDASPDMEGLQLSFDAGDGRLFLLPGN